MQYPDVRLAPTQALGHQRGQPAARQHSPVQGTIVMGGTQEKDYWYNGIDHSPGLVHILSAGAEGEAQASGEKPDRGGIKLSYSSRFYLQLGILDQL